MKRTRPALASLLSLLLCGWLFSVTFAQAPQTGTVLQNANLRSGPGTNYTIVGKAIAGQTVQVVDRNVAATWYKLSDGKWIAASLVDLSPLSADNTDPITVVGWNTQLNDADIQVIASSIAAFQDVDLWGLAEVNRASDVPDLEMAAAVGENADFGSVLSVSGGSDRLLALYDQTRFTLLDSFELDTINTTGNARAPLVLHLREKRTGEELLFMVNHLYRTREEERYTQAMLLNTWEAKQTLPVIAVGDYNFDWDVKSGVTKHDEGYDLLTAKGRFTWVEPATLVTSQCSGWPCTYNSVLDFVFAGGVAQLWRAESEIVVQAGDFPDDNTTSDHRPVLARFWPDTQAAPPVAATQATPFPTPTLASTPTQPVRASATAAPATAIPSTPTPPPPVTAPARSGSANVAVVVLENSGKHEIVGISNNGSTALDISGWRFTGSKGNDSCTIPNGTTLQPGQVYQVATGDSQPVTPGYKCGNKTIWNNQGETIYLDSPDGQHFQR